MANRLAAALVLRDGDFEVLTRLVRSSSAQRARIVLLAAEGLSNTEIAHRAGVARGTVISWRERYLLAGLTGLEDGERSGRPRVLEHWKIVAETLKPPPKRLGVTHWSSRLLAARLGVANSTVARVWRAYGVQPWRSGTFRFSTDPELVAKVTDVAGSAGERGGAVRGREIPDPGTGPDRADPADAAAPDRTAHSGLCP